MKKLITFVLAASLLLSFTTVANAEGRFQNRRQEVKQREKLTELKKTIVTNFFNNMVKRLQAAEDRLNKILTRIESRVAKDNITSVDPEIASVKTKLTDTQTKIDKLKSGFDALVVSDTPKEAFKTVKGDIQSVKKDLQDIRVSLSKIIGDIKGLRNDK